jgi:hypothetical protein
MRAVLVGGQVAHEGRGEVCICQDLEHIASILEEKQERKLEITRQRKPVAWKMSAPQRR